MPPQQVHAFLSAGRRLRHCCPGLLLLALALILLPRLQVNAQQTPTVFTKLYDNANKPLLSIPSPIPADYFPSVKQELSGKTPSYVRIYTTLNAPASRDDAEAVLNEASNHIEDRSDTRVKLVAWTEVDITSKVMEIMIRGIQTYAQRLATARQGGSQPSEGMRVEFDRTFLSRNVRDVEVEVMTVSKDVLIRHPLCRRNNTLPNSYVGRAAPLPCPSFILADQMYTATWAQNNMLMPLETLIANGTLNPIPDLPNPNLFNLRKDGNWYGVPAWLDTRLLVFNRKVLEELRLKLPPPHSDWGTPYTSQWTWEKMVEYAAAIKNAGKGDGFVFQAGWDEENKLIPMIARSFGSSVFDGDGKCSMENQRFQDGLAKTIGQLWKPGNLIANKQFVPANADFKAWLNDPLADPLLLQPTFASPEERALGTGITLLSQSKIRNGVRADFTFVGGAGDIAAAEYLPAFAPGTGGYIGGTSISLLRSSWSPSLAWSLVTFLIAPQNPYISDVSRELGILPPYTSMRSRAPFNGADFALIRTQLESVTPFHAPTTALPSSGDYADRKPFRLMMMELVFRDVSVADATKRACQIVNNLALPECSRTVFGLRFGKCSRLNDFRSFPLSAKELNNGTCRTSVDRTISVNLECTYIDYESIMAIVMYAVAGAAVFALLVTLAVVLYRRGKISNTYGDTTSLVLMLFGGTLMAGAGFLFLGFPSTVMCSGRMWMAVIGFTILFGLLLSHQSALLLLVLSLINISLLLLWTFIPPGSGARVDNQDIREFEQANVLRSQRPICSLGNSIVFYSLLGFNAFLLLITVLNSFMRCLNRPSTDDKSLRETKITSLEARAGAAANILGILFAATAISFAFAMPDFRMAVFGIALCVVATGSICAIVYVAIVLRWVQQQRGVGSANSVNLMRTQKDLPPVSGRASETTSIQFGRSHLDADDTQFDDTAMDSRISSQTPTAFGRPNTGYQTESVQVRPVTLMTSANRGESMYQQSNYDGAASSVAGGIGLASVMDRPYSSTTFFTQRNGGASGANSQFQTMYMDDTMDGERPLDEIPLTPPPPIIVRNTTMMEPASLEDNGEVFSPSADDPDQLFRHRKSAYQSVHTNRTSGFTMATNASRRGTMFPEDQRMTMSSAELPTLELEKTMNERFANQQGGESSSGEGGVVPGPAGNDADARKTADSTTFGRLTEYYSQL